MCTMCNNWHSALGSSKCYNAAFVRPGVRAQLTYQTRFYRCSYQQAFLLLVKVQAPSGWDGWDNKLKDFNINIERVHAEILLGITDY